MRYTLFLLACFTGVVSRWIGLLSIVFVLLLFVLPFFFDAAGRDQVWNVLGWSLPTLLIATMVMISSMWAQKRLK